MIALAWLFLLAAIATLLIGVFSEPIAWIWASIGSSALAMILLVVGIVRGKPVQPATAGAPYGPPVGTADARGRPAAAKSTATATAPAATAPAGTATQRRPSTPSAPTAPARKPAAKKPAAKKAAPSKTPAKKTAAKKTTAASTSTGAMVVAIPERGTYHTPQCRYVQGRTDTERLKSSTAKSRGFKACGVCKP